MIVVETNHSLSNSEIALLQSLIGQSITLVCAAKACETHNPFTYEFDDAINLQLSEGIYIAISGEFGDE